MPSSELLRELRAGNFLRVFDAGWKLYREGGDSAIEAAYLATLALARSGATQNAAVKYEQAGLGRSGNSDHIALGARIAKDMALSASPDKRPALLIKAAQQYAALHRQKGDYYPAINAATLYHLAGQHGDERDQMASAARVACEQIGFQNGLSEYYRLATLAEIALLENDTPSCVAALEQAILHAQGDYAAMATTRKQLALLLAPEKRDCLAPLNPPEVIHYCGHMVSDAPERRLTSTQEARLADCIAKLLQERDVGFGFGALACGADLIVAEALLARCAELHVVLPFKVEEFIEISVRPGGAHWEHRFNSCLSRASSVTYSCEDAYLGDDALFAYGTRLAAGMAVDRARNISAKAWQLAIWDGGITSASAGTGADVSFWQSLGRDTHAIHPRSCHQSWVDNTIDHTSFASAPTASNKGRRCPRSMLFGDVKGFSKLEDALIPAFVEKILGSISQVLEEFRDDVQSANTWGDGLFVVFDNPGQAAQCGLRMQETMRKLDLEGAGLPKTLGLRIGIHHGPIYTLEDPVLQRSNHFGAHVSRAARIEPITPPGEVYVSRQMAAELSLIEGANLDLEYVGTVPTAKNYGDYPMYLLRRPMNFAV